jgi:hypothetical protein
MSTFNKYKNNRLLLPLRPNSKRVKTARLEKVLQNIASRGEHRASDAINYYYECTEIKPMLPLPHDFSADFSAISKVCINYAKILDVGFLLNW